MKYLTLEDIKAYQIAYELSNYVWRIVVKWNYKEINTLIYYTNLKLQK